MHFTLISYSNKCNYALMEQYFKIYEISLDAFEISLNEAALIFNGKCINVNNKIIK